MRTRRAQRVGGASGSLSRMAIAVGDSAEQTFQVTDEVLEHFGAATGDLNPMHFDDAFAATTMFGGRIAHGMLTAGFISTMIGMVLPGPGSIYLGQTLQFRAPVQAGRRGARPRRGDGVRPRAAARDASTPVRTWATSSSWSGEARVIAPE